MDTIRIDVTGTRQVGLRFEEFPDALYADLRREVDALTVELLVRVQAATPTKTGELRSQERLRIFADKTKITGKIDIAGNDAQDYRKAAALEYGSTGRPVTVKSHEMALDHFWANKLAAPMTVVTKAYARTPNIMENAFERGPLAAMQPEIIARLNAVVTNDVKAANG